MNGLAIRDDKATVLVREHRIAEPVDKARELGAAAEGREAEFEEARSLPVDLVGRLRDSGLTRLLQPAAYGGEEAGFLAVTEVLIELARHSGSLAWICMVFNTGSMLAGFPKDAQEEVWRTDPHAFIGATFAPGRSIEAVDGGHLVSGEWSFASGVDHADWMMVGGLLRGQGPIPELHFFLLPRSDFHVEDSWHVTGLRGTGSKTLVAERAFVPDHRRINFADLREGRAAAAHHPGPIYRVPLAAAFHGGAAAPAAGIALGAIDRWTEWTKGRVAHGVVQVSGQATTQIHLGEAASMAEASALLLRSDADRVMGEAEGGYDFTLADRARYHRNAAYACRLALDAVDLLFDQSGGSGLYTRQRIQQSWRDIHAAAAHISNRWDDAMEHYGRITFGLGPGNPFFF